MVLLEKLINAIANKDIKYVPKVVVYHRMVIYDDSQLFRMQIFVILCDSSARRMEASRVPHTTMMDYSTGDQSKLAL